MYENIHIGSEVEVCQNNGVVLSAKVKWKGAISYRKGEWIGVELYGPDGNHDGFLHGRRYYQCRAFHGLFVRPSQVRFIKTKASLRNTRYKSVSKDSTADEMLFMKRNFEPCKNFSQRPITLSASAYSQITKALDSSDSGKNKKKTFRKSHSVGGRLTPAKQDTPKGGLSSNTINMSPTTVFIHKTDPSYNYFLTTRSSYSSTFDENEQTFRNPSSIPTTCRIPAHCQSTECFYERKQISKQCLNKTF